MNSRQALDFIRYHGVVLEAARGAEPSLAELVAGEKIRGSWWAHPEGQAIFELIQKIRNSRAVLICTLVNGRITYIHRRLWPSFVRLSDRFPARSLDKVNEVHLPSGRHKRDDVPFPDWVSDEVLEKSRRLRETEAEKQISIWLKRYAL